jgi:ankyrin repeat protein
LIAIVIVEGLPVIQFSHFSVKEYLTSTRIAEGHVSRYYIPLEPAHLFVTQACLSVLLQIERNVTKEGIEEFLLARYAGQNWADHAEFGDVSSHTEILIKRLFNPENHHFANWTRIYETISNLSDPSGREWAPLHYAAQHGFPRVVEWLITTCSQDVNALGLELATPLLIASRDGRFTAAQALLNHGANVDAGDSLGNTPLHDPSRRGDYKIARLLLEHGADVNSKTIGNETPLRLLAGESGNLEVAQLLLEHGADPSIRSGTGRDSLYMALRNGRSGLAQLLLKHGADPNTRDFYGRTLLHVASKLGDLNVAQGLLELGVDVNSHDKGGQTPLQVAGNDSANGQVVQLLLKHGAKRT